MVVMVRISTPKTSGFVVQPKELSGDDEDFFRTIMDFLTQRISSDMTGCKGLSKQLIPNIGARSLLKTPDHTFASWTSSSQRFCFSCTNRLLLPTEASLY